MINKRFVESYYIYYHNNTCEAARSPIHFVPYAVYCIQVRQINPGGGTGAGRLGGGRGIRLVCWILYTEWGRLPGSGVTAGQCVSVPGGWHEPEWEERKSQGAHDTEDSLRSTANTCRDRDRQGLHHKGNSGLRMDMPGFLRLRAWDATREQEKKKPRQRFIDEVWPGMKPG